MKGYLLHKQDQGHYSYTIRKNSVTLFFSRVGNWSEHVRRKIAARIKNVDDGVNYEITFNSGRTFSVDICELNEIRLLLRLYKRNTPNAFDAYREVKFK